MSGAPMLLRSAKIAVMGLVVSAMLIGCSGPLRKPQKPDVREGAFRKVVFGPGDALEFKFFNTPQLNETQTVLPDGTVTLELIGEVLATGKTPEELRKELIERYSSKLKNPEIVVVARSLNSRRIYVGGEVTNPGLLPLTGPMSVIEAVMHAGGFLKESAQIGNVIVVRHYGDQRRGYSVDCKQALRGKPAVEFPLEPGDIVFVPKTRISNANQWIDQHISRMLPAAIWGMLPWAILYP